jgi:ribonucleoside-diphosphate reductase subunit M1
VRVFFARADPFSDALLVNPKNGKPAGMISKETYDIVCANAELLDSAIIYNRDFNYNLYEPTPLAFLHALMIASALASKP